MFVLSLSLKKKKTGLILLAVFLIIITAYFIKNSGGFIATAAKPADTLKTNQDRVTFLSGFGWQVSEEPVEIADIYIPGEFSDVYEKYNEIQKVNGYDLTKYKGKNVKRYSYEVLNYPSDSGESNTAENIRANILIYNNKVIGGDICSLELGGFMHGFELKI